MRVALLLFCLCASTAALSAPIGETRYRLEGVHPYPTYADGEHLIRAGTIFQRAALRRFREIRRSVFVSARTD